MNEVDLKQLFYGAVTIGERGQVVVPAEARKACHMDPGDKLLVFGHPMGAGVFLTKVENVQAFLGAMQQLAGVDENAGESG